MLLETDSSYELTKADVCGLTFQQNLSESVSFIAIYSIVVKLNKLLLFNVF